MIPLPDTTILAGYVGSIAHGTYRPNSNPNSIDDIDIMAIYFGNLRSYAGIEKDEHKVFKENEWDITCYEIRKFFTLLLNNNPNVMSFLWLSNYIVLNEQGKELVDARELFSSKKAYKSFSGYAYAQIKKMEHLAFEGYMGDKRKHLVEKFGYDTKNASHAIRLLRQGIEFLNTGKILVLRPDAEELLNIKDGLWTLEQVKLEADRLYAVLEKAYKESSLPDEPQYEPIYALLERMTLGYLVDKK